MFYCRWILPVRHESPVLHRTWTSREGKKEIKISLVVLMTKLQRLLLMCLQCGRIFFIYMFKMLLKT